MIEMTLKTQKMKYSYLISFFGGLDEKLSGPLFAHACSRLLLLEKCNLLEGLRENLLVNFQTFWLIYACAKISTKHNWVSYENAYMIKFCVFLFCANVIGRISNP